MECINWNVLQNENFWLLAVWVSSINIHPYFSAKSEIALNKFYKIAKYSAEFMWIPDGLCLSPLSKSVLTMGITLWNTSLLESVHSIIIQMDRNILEVNMFPSPVARVGSSDLYSISFCRTNLSRSLTILSADDGLDSSDEPSPETKNITKFRFFLSQNVTLQVQEIEKNPK
jgi:hypothetical protein